MAEGFLPVVRCQEGGVSLVSANYANQIIDTLNRLGLVTISPVANVGAAKMAGNGLILDLSALDGRLKKLESLLYVNGTASIENRVSNIEYRLNHANISGSGTCSGNNISINVSLNI